MVSNFTNHNDPKQHSMWTWDQLSRHAADDWFCGFVSVQTQVKNILQNFRSQRCERQLQALQNWRLF
tara:strand:+ start:173 stop:373 length:201 start_codon:yes stop_codon:yes gene_type:complete